MNKGTAIYQGERVFFTSNVFNPWTGKLDFLVVLDGEAIWVRHDELRDVQYVISA